MCRYWQPKEAMADAPKPLLSRRQRQQSERRTNAICFSKKRAVFVSFEFVSIGEIDMMNERFQGEVIIESKWLLTEDKDRDMLHDQLPGEQHKFDPKVHWNPELYIENAHTNIREQKKYAVSKGKASEYYVTEYRLVKGNFWQRVELENVSLGLLVIVTGLFLEREL